MALKMAAHILIALAIGVQSSENVADCGEEFRQCALCARTKVSDRFHESAWAKIDFHGIHDAVMACFENEEISCKNILTEMEKTKEFEDEIDKNIEMAKDELRKRVGPLIQAMGKNEEQMKQIIESGIKCGSKMLPTLHQGISTCVSQIRPELANFELPPLPMSIIMESNETDAENERAGIRNLIKGMMLMKVSNGDPIRQFIFEAIIFNKIDEEFKWALTKKVFAEETCGGDFDKSQKLAKCLEDAMVNNVPEELACSNRIRENFRFFGTIRQMCNDMNACAADESEVCSELHQQLPNMICSCGQSYIESEFATIAENITSCMDAELPEDNKFNVPPIILRGSFKDEAIELLDLTCKQIDINNNIVDPSVCSDEFSIEAMFDNFKPIADKFPTPQQNRVFHRQPMIESRVGSMVKSPHLMMVDDPNDIEPMTEENQIVELEGSIDDNGESITIEDNIKDGSGEGAIDESESTNEDGNGSEEQSDRKEEEALINSKEEEALNSTEIGEIVRVTEGNETFVLTEEENANGTEVGEISLGSVGNETNVLTEEENANATEVEGNVNGSKEKETTDDASEEEFVGDTEMEEIVTGSNGNETIAAKDNNVEETISGLTGNETAVIMKEEKPLME